MKRLFIIPIICFFIACESKNIIDPNSIYGYWESYEICNENPIGRKLDFMDSSTVWIDPVVNDSIYFYNSCFIRNDSLILQYKNSIRRYYIEDLDDSILVLKHDNGKYKYKNKQSYYDNGHFVGYCKSRSIEGIPNDSLDIIIKSIDEIERIGEPYILNTKEMTKARELINEFLKNKKYQKKAIYAKTKLGNLNDYGRQYLSIKKNGRIYVYAIIFDKYVDHNIGYMALKEHSVENSGYIIKIDLLNNCIVDFWSNQHII